MGNGEWGNFRFWILDFGLIGNFKITMTVNFGIVLVTAGSEVEAETIAKSLVENKLAAGVSLSAVRSIYTWQGEIHDKAEWQLVIKTDLAKFEDLKTKVQELHSYEVPEIIAIPIVAGSEAYLDWIGQSIGL
jgi:periplasmic divalent cation tolerance protein